MNNFTYVLMTSYEEPEEKKSKLNARDQKDVEEAKRILKVNGWSEK